MDQDFKNQERIQEYLQGNLKGADLKAFQADLKKDAALQEDLTFSQAMMATLKNKEIIAVNHQLKPIIAGKTIQPDFEALKEFERVKSGKGKIGKWLLGSILGISILVFGLFASGRFNTSVSNDAPNPIVAPHLIPFESVISADGTKSPNLKKGMIAYENEDYTTVIAALSTHLKEAYDPNVQFYLGVAHLLNQESAVAIPVLERAVDTSVPPILSVAKWYLALAYIEAGQLPEAKESLKELQSDSAYVDKATALLDSLENQLLQ